VKLVHRTAEVWRPIEEFVAFACIMFSETDKSLSLMARIFSAATLPFRADASEGFQGAAAAVPSQEIKGLRAEVGPLSRLMES